MSIIFKSYGSVLNSDDKPSPSPFVPLHQIEKCEEALAHLFNGALKGHNPSQYELGSFFLRSKKVKLMRKGMYWLNIASSNGNNFATYEIAKNFRRNAPVVNDSPTPYLTWLEAAAKRGHHDACTDYGALLETWKRYDEAAKIYSSAALGGHVKSANTLIQWLNEGIKIPKDCKYEMKLLKCISDSVLDGSGERLTAQKQLGTSQSSKFALLVTMSDYGTKLQNHTNLINFF